MSDAALPPRASRALELRRNRPASSLVVSIVSATEVPKSVAMPAMIPGEPENVVAHLCTAATVCVGCSAVNVGGAGVGGAEKIRPMTAYCIIATCARSRTSSNRSSCSEEEKRSASPPTAPGTSSRIRWAMQRFRAANLNSRLAASMSATGAPASAPMFSLICALSSETAVSARVTGSTLQVAFVRCSYQNCGKPLVAGTEGHFDAVIIVCR